MKGNKWTEENKNTKNWAKTLPDPTKKAPVRATILLIQEAVDNVLMSRDKVVSTDVLVVCICTCRCTLNASVTPREMISHQGSLLKNEGNFGSSLPWCDDAEILFTGTIFIANIYKFSNIDKIFGR